MAIFDTLYCEEEQWELEEDEDESVEENNNISNEGTQNPSLFPILLLQQDLLWEDEELITLFSKEEKQGISKQGNFYFDLSISSARKEAVEWMLMVNSHYGFCTLTSVLAVNYLDRFLSIFHFQKEKPWMMQLLSVTCLSLAAKVEETDVPILLDLQVDGTEYMFEPKTIQKMELLVLSTLEWKMNPVTPLSFLDYIIRRLGLKNHLHWEFLRRCESLLLSLLPDWRFVSYLPSVLATASMMHVIDQIQLCNPQEYQNQLLSVLNISKEKVKECYQVMVEISATKNKLYEEMMNKKMPNSPSGVIESAYDYCLSSDTSNDSWPRTTTSTTIISNYNLNHDNHNNHDDHINEGSSSLSSSLSLSSSDGSYSPALIRRKKRRVHEQHMISTLHLSSLSNLFVDVVGNPR